MNINKYKTEYGYMDDKGEYWDNAINFIQGSILGFSCYGQPIKNLKYVYECLYLAKLRYNPYQDKKYKEKKDEFFKNDEEMYFAWYFLVSKGLTEHNNNNIPGWLTEKGKNLMENCCRLLGR